MPFCASKCDYCDFVSVAGADPDFVEVVFAGIRTQVTTWSRSGLDGVIETIYFGGGTPSLHPEQVVRTLAHIRNTLVVHPNAEITVEANPDSMSPEVAAAFAAHGVTRVSVGVQSFDDHVLRVLGRRHDAASAARACQAVVATRDGALGRPDVRGPGTDDHVMVGDPVARRPAAVRITRRSTRSPSRHETPMAVAISAGLLSEPDSDEAADMMVLAEESLGYHGLSRYEIANYADSREHESRHNTAYWTGRPYAGLGPGAHGMLDAATARAVGLLSQASQDIGRVRYGNAASISDWLVGQGDTRRDAHVRGGAPRGRDVGDAPRPRRAGV